MAASLQDIDVAVSVRGDGARIDQRRRGCLGSIGRYTALAVAGDRADDAGLQVHGADAAIIQIG